MPNLPSVQHPDGSAAGCFVLPGTNRRVGKNDGASVFIVVPGCCHQRDAFPFTGSCGHTGCC
ncbi:hypothetical protein TMES_01890 [Thalassospira mesophila]|uniref:Uncharacterized protein n=1 Tax=Thalassospira mesophila TaxID=1293891 RepID=A0A1Y2L4E1_9PROT|nr:hypothetical protein TMES_01890 [Thalassospira mesophila]